MATHPVISIQPLGFPWETLDPFLFCVHHEDFYPAGNPDMSPAASLAGRNLGNDFTVKDGFRMYHGHTVPGFPAHPHRGFETVTIARRGIIDHSDSLGATGRFGHGDVQWMTAGKGVQHSEMFPLINQTKENPFEIFQIWLNLPSYNKLVDPHFAMLWHENIPVYESIDKSGKKTTINIIAGSLDGKKAPSPPPDSWASDPLNEIAIWTITLEPGATWTLPQASLGINRALYFFKGESIQLAGKSLAVYHSARLQPEMTLDIVNGTEKGELLLLQGKPIGEPVVQHGPFVMNTPQQIQEAIREFQQDHFGGWPWPSPDHVHAKEKGRFARYADGKEEVKGEARR